MDEFLSVPKNLFNCCSLWNSETNQFNQFAFRTYKITMLVWCFHVSISCCDGILSDQRTPCCHDQFSLPTQPFNIIFLLAKQPQIQPSNKCCLLWTRSFQPCNSKRIFYCLLCAFRWILSACCLWKWLPTNGGFKPCTPWKSTSAVHWMFFVCVKTALF